MQFFLKALPSGWFLLFVVCFPLIASGEIQPQKVNLALRRTADLMLRAAGDSTTRIAPVERLNDTVWRINLNGEVIYDRLPAILQSSLDRYEIRESYEVTIRSCDSNRIDLGYHQLDFLQDSVVPCGTRVPPQGCHYIEVTFLGGMHHKTNSAGIWLVLLFGLTGGAGVLWWLRRKPGPVVTPHQNGHADWVEFGRSKLNVAGQVLECGGEKQTLTYREAKLLGLFVSHPDQLLERDVILRQVWADEGVQVSRSVDVFVSRLRKKLTGDPSVSIVAVHGVGYKLETSN